MQVVSSAALHSLTIAHDIVLLVPSATLYALISQILSNENNNWKLVSLDERKPHGVAPAFLQKWVRSPYFTTAFMVIVLTDALVAASLTNETERDMSAQTVNWTEDWRYCTEV